eukprot:SAG31_NODE_4090_length_3600_cov_4.861183_2_plen_85_part_00
MLPVEVFSFSVVQRWTTEKLNMPENLNIFSVVQRWTTDKLKSLHAARRSSRSHREHDFPIPPEVVRCVFQVHRARLLLQSRPAG